MKSSSIKKVLILVSILAIPGFLFFYLLPHFAKNRYKSLPYFGEKRIASTFHSVKGKKIPDTIYHQVQDFSLTNQSGKTLGWSDYLDKIVVVNLFNPALGDQQAMAYFKQLSDSYEKKPLVKFISISVNPADSDLIKPLTAKLNVLPYKWDLLTGDTVQTYPLIRNGLLLDVVSAGSENKSSYIFSNKIVLLDYQHHIRGFYESDNKEATGRLEDEIKVLIAEYLRNLKDGR